MILVRLDIDTQENGKRSILGVVVTDEAGEPLAYDLKVRDYGRGDTPDEGGALYLDVSEDFR